MGFWGVFSGLLAFLFMILSLLSLFKPGPKTANRKSRGIRSYIFQILFVFSLNLFAYTQKPEVLQTAIFCFFGEAILLLIVLGVMMMRLNSHEKYSLEEIDLFSLFRKKRK